MPIGDLGGMLPVLIRDRNTKSRVVFGDVFTGNGTPVIKTPIQAPGEQHLRKVPDEYAAATTGHLSHQAQRWAGRLRMAFSTAARLVSRSSAGQAPAQLLSMAGSRRGHGDGTAV